MNLSLILLTSGEKDSPGFIRGETDRITGILPHPVIVLHFNSTNDNKNEEHTVSPPRCSTRMLSGI